MVGYLPTELVTMENKRSVPSRVIYTQHAARRCERGVIQKFGKRRRGVRSSPYGGTVCSAQVFFSHRIGSQGMHAHLGRGARLYFSHSTCMPGRRAEECTLKDRRVAGYRGECHCHISHFTTATPAHLPVDCSLRRTCVRNECEVCQMCNRIAPSHSTLAPPKAPCS